MKEQIKTPRKEQIHRKTNNLSDAEFKTLAIRMLTEIVEYGHKIQGKEKSMKSENKEEYIGNQQ